MHAMYLQIFRRLNDHYSTAIIGSACFSAPLLPCSILILTFKKMLLAMDSNQSRISRRSHLLSGLLTGAYGDKLLRNCRDWII